MSYSWILLQWYGASLTICQTLKKKKIHFEVIVCSLSRSKHGTKALGTRNLRTVCWKVPFASLKKFRTQSFFSTISVRPNSFWLLDNCSTFVSWKLQKTLLQLVKLNNFWVFNLFRKDLCCKAHSSSGNSTVFGWTTSTWSGHSSSLRDLYWFSFILCFTSLSVSSKDVEI